MSSQMQAGDVRASLSAHESRPGPDKRVMYFASLQGASESRLSRVICLPHAGCGAAAFKTLAGPFFQDRDMVVVQYPGRETRLRDPLTCDMQELVDEILPAVAPYLDEPYILFGHSMGSKVAFELLQRLQNQNRRLPESLIVSCSPAPHRASGLNPAFKQDDAGFLTYLKRLGGVPRELLDVPDLLEMVLPILRNDFELLYRYRATANHRSVACPLYAIASPQDISVRQEDVAYWQELAGDVFRLMSLEGGHFYFPQQKMCLSTHLA